MSSLLEVRSVVADYGGNPVVDGVSLSIDDGEVVALLGSNGAGKTTTLKVLAGLVMPSRGEVSLNGIAFIGMVAHERARHGLVLIPEGRRLFPGLTVLENLRAGKLARAGRGDESADLCRVFELFPVLQRKQQSAAGTLSGGEQQMLAIGRGLMSAPRLLMIDEPSLGLSPIAVRALYEVLAALAATGLAILIAEQNLRVALRVSQRAYVLRQGEIVFSGSTSELNGRTDLPELYLGNALSTTKGGA